MTRNFHHSKLRRQQEVEMSRRRRKIEWFQKLYGMKEPQEYGLEDASPMGGMDEYTPRISGFCT